MRTSQWLMATQKETPADAEIISHQLMLRAGLIRKLGSGLYTWLPLGLRVLRKIERIVREEMNRSGALEILMPAIQPAELWEETGRWETFGGQLLTMKDSNGRAYCFGPTHEEVVTDLIRREVQSWRQLPLTVYQIQTKFRDEIRPRFGVMRAREFLMKDAYSFHLTEESLRETYQCMYDTYCRILERMGLQYRAVEADTGAIGGSASHEFQVLADAGEDLLFWSDGSNYAANIEQATSLLPPPAKTWPAESMQEVATPGLKSIDAVSAHLGVSPCQTVKTLVVKGREHPLVALVLRGDDTLNELKAAKHPLVNNPLTFASDEEIEQALGVPVGFLGPVALTIPIIADHHALALEGFVCGANKADTHCQNAAWERDVCLPAAFDLRNVREGDKSPDGKGTLHACRGIEVGHVFQLGNKYAKAMQANVMDESGQLQTLLMGCYGIGVSRLVAASIEQHHDEHGIVWPESIAPFNVVIIPLNGARSEKVREVGESLYQACLAKGMDVLLDDRNERPGVLFADSELMGIPHRLVVGERNLAEGFVEYRARTGTENIRIPLSEAVEYLEKHMK